MKTCHTRRAIESSVRGVYYYILISMLPVSQEEKNRRQYCYCNFWTRSECLMRWLYRSRSQIFCVDHYVLRVNLIRVKWNYLYSALMYRYYACREMFHRSENCQTEIFQAQVFGFFMTVIKRNTRACLLSSVYCPKKYLHVWKCFPLSLRL